MAATAWQLRDEASHIVFHSFALRKDRKMDSRSVICLGEDPALRMVAERLAEVCLPKTLRMIR